MIVVSHLNSPININLYIILQIANTISNYFHLIFNKQYKTLKKKELNNFEKVTILSICLFTDPLTAMITDRNKLNFVTIQWPWFLCLILFTFSGCTNIWIQNVEATQQQQLQTQAQTQTQPQQQQQQLQQHDKLQQQLKSALQMQQDIQSNGPIQQTQKQQHQDVTGMTDDSISFNR